MFPKIMIHTFGHKAEWKNILSLTLAPRLAFKLTLAYGTFKQKKNPPSGAVLMLPQPSTGHSFIHSFLWYDESIAYI